MASAKLCAKGAIARIVSSLKSQWLATALIIPLVLLAAQTYVTRQEAREARAQAFNLERVTKIQDSGKALDLALSAYFHSIADLGLAERRLVAPGEFKAMPVEVAQANVIERRNEARKALAEHASDVQRLRGTIDSSSADLYMTSLASISEVIDYNADINLTGRNITALSKLVVSRNALIDSAMSKVG